MPRLGGVLLAAAVGGVLGLLVPPRTWSRPLVSLPGLQSMRAAAPSAVPDPRTPPRVVEPAARDDGRLDPQQFLMEDTEDPRNLYQRGLALKEVDPQAALALFKRARDRADVGSALYVVARSQIAKLEAQSDPKEKMEEAAHGRARDIYLQAYALKDADRSKSRRLFWQVLKMTPMDDEYHLRARRQLGVETEYASDTVNFGPRPGSGGSGAAMKQLPAGH